VSNHKKVKANMLIFFIFLFIIEYILTDDARHLIFFNTCEIIYAHIMSCDIHHTTVLYVLNQSPNSVLKLKKRGEERKKIS